MERKTIQLSPEHHNWLASYKTKRGFKNTETAFEEIRNLADEHFFDIRDIDRKPRYELVSDDFGLIYWDNRNKEKLTLDA